MTASDEIHMFVRQLNRNLYVLESAIMKLADRYEEMRRDSAALHRATIEFLKEKNIIQNEEDLKLLRKLHMQHIAALDQRITEQQNKQNPQQP